MTKSASASCCRRSSPTRATGALAENAPRARARARERPDLVLLDIWMPDTDGITLLKEWAASGQLTMPVVMMSGHGTIETAVEATRIGALDFLEKPIALQRLLATVKRALRKGEAAAPGLALASLGRSAALADLRKRLAQIAQWRAADAARRARHRCRSCSRGAPAAEYALAGGGLGARRGAAGFARAAAGGLLSSRTGGARARQQKNLDFVAARTEENKTRLVSFSAEDRALAEELGFDAALLARLAELCCCCRRCANTPRTCPISPP